MLIALFLSALDIYTKKIAFERVDYISKKTAGVHDHIKVAEYLNIVKVVNTGMLFGALNNLPHGELILSIFVAMILIFVVYLLWNVQDKYNAFAYLLIMAGGLGNLYDRIVRGGVFDFLDFHYQSYHWPAFNLADSFVCIGVALVILGSIRLASMQHR